MTIIQGYMKSILVPQLQSLGLTSHQQEIVAKDVTRRLESLLSHWSDLPFRRAILVLGTEEACFWEPRSAGLEIRALVAVAVRNSLIEDIHATRAYTRELRSPTPLLRDERMSWITGEAINYFAAVNFESVTAQPSKDIFGSLPRRFPNAWHVLSLLGNSTDSEMDCSLPMANADPVNFSIGAASGKRLLDIASGIDPRVSDPLAKILEQVQRKEAELFFSFSFRGISRNPEKLLAIIDHVLRCGGTVATPNYLLSPRYLARRSPLLRPAHFADQMAAQLANPVGLSELHRHAIASIGLLEM
jgi:hypothetical protein